MAHGTLGRALLATALGLPEQAFRYFALKNGEVVEAQKTPMFLSTIMKLKPTILSIIVIFVFKVR